MSICTAAVVLSFAASVAAAPVKQDAKKTTTASDSKKTPKLSKWQQHVLDVLKSAAPGDEYFGRMKMSYLGINNTFHDDAIRAGAYTTDPHLISNLSFADDALTAWSKKYPNDPQLARSYFLAFQMYRKVWTQPYQQKAWTYAHIVMQKWPTSFFGKALKKDLAIGYTEHYFATPVACASLVATASAAPTASPAPTPTPTTAPGQPKIDILPVPCTTPTPSPSPIPTPTNSSSPTTTTSASPSPTPTPTHHP